MFLQLLIFHIVLFPFPSLLKKTANKAPLLWWQTCYLWWLPRIKAPLLLVCLFLFKGCGYEIRKFWVLWRISRRKVNMMKPTNRDAGVELYLKPQSFTSKLQKHFQLPFVSSAYIWVKCLVSGVMMAQRDITPPCFVVDQAHLWIILVAVILRVWLHCSGEIQGHSYPWQAQAKYQGQHTINSGDNVHP